jgi:hypothetical protein
MGFGKLEAARGRFRGHPCGKVLESLWPGAPFIAHFANEWALAPPLPCRSFHHNRSVPTVTDAQRAQCENDPVMGQALGTLLWYKLFDNRIEDKSPKLGRRAGPISVKFWGKTMITSTKYLFLNTLELRHLDLKLWRKTGGREHPPK